MNNINESWHMLLTAIMEHGVNSKPRGMKTKEIIGYQSVIDMNQPIITVPQRDMNYKFMCGEAHWILSGSNRVEDITRFMKAIAKFSDDGMMFNGAYGPKVIDQLSYVVQCLKRDADSRQAVLNIWRENPGPSKDIPCTLNLQWFIRGNKLHCKANMRSSDAWLGWVYDTFNFSMISAWVAICLLNDYPGLELGSLFLSTGSQHLYENNFEAAESVIENFEREEINPIDLFEFDSPYDLTYLLEQAGLENWEVIDSPFLLQIKDLK